MTDSPVTFESLLGRVQQRLDKERAARRRLVDGFNREALAWLALVPAWTEPLARICNFPAGEGGLDEFLTRASQAGFCMRQEATEAGAGKVLMFWMPERARVEVQKELAEQYGQPFLARVTGEIGRALWGAMLRGLVTSLPPVLAQWAELAAKFSGGRADAGAVAGLWLKGRIQGLLDGAETGEALAWLETGEELGLALVGQFADAVQAAGQKLKLAFQRTLEKRGLRYFVKRDDQVEAFHRLLDHPEEGWALHYVGMGGIGKTTLLRYISARLAPERKVPTARVDFDHLNPNYPVRRPAQLFLGLAEGLRPHTASLTAENSSLFNSKLDDLKRLAEEFHRRLDTEALAANPLEVLGRGHFVSALLNFCALVDLLPRPVVLILDTCEELTRLQPEGARLPNVEATFAILERVHAQLQSQSPGQDAGLRVIFAGRRLLAQGGRGWVVNRQLPAENWDYLPARKDYLKLAPLNGFTERNADTYFGLKEASLTGPLREAVLEQSREQGPPLPVVWDDPPPVCAPVYYNPFDLSLYTDWVSEDPSLDAMAVTSGGLDPYVEMRIIRRIKVPAVQGMLSGVVLLRRFNCEMLAPLVTGTDLSPETAYLHLASQEWTDYRPGATPQSTYLEISPRLYPRLLKYFEHDERRGQLDAARDLLVPWLTSLVTNRRLGDLDVPHLDAALRLLEGREQDAVALWRSVQERVARDAGWHWALTVTGRLLGEEGAVSRKDHPLRAWVRAVHTSALIHVQPDLDVRPGWAEVAETSANYLPVDRLWLLLRVLAGHLAVQFRKGEVVSPLRSLRELLLGYQRWLGGLSGFVAGLPVGSAARLMLTRKQGESSRDLLEPLVSAICAAFEAWLEWAEARQEQGLPWQPPEHQVRPADGAQGPGEDVDAAQANYYASMAQIYGIAPFLPPPPDNEPGPAPDPQPAQADNFSAWAERLDPHFVGPELSGFVHLLALRDAVLRRSWGELQAILTRLEKYQPVPNPKSVEDRWPDWLAPASLPDRVRLELLRLSRKPGGLAFLPGPPLQIWGLPLAVSERAEGLRFDPKYLAWQSEALQRVQLIDAERLLSRLLSLRLEYGVVPAAELEACRAGALSEVPRRAECNAHRSVPPLFITLAHGWLALGRGDQALAILDEGLARGQAQGLDDASYLGANRARLQVYRRLRMGGEGENLTTQMEDASGWDDVALAYAVRAVNGSPNVHKPPPGEFLSRSPRQVHGWWCGHYALTREQARRGLEFADQVLTFEPILEYRRGNDYGALLLQLDWQEAVLLARRLGEPRRDAFPLPFDARSLALSSLHPDEAARVLLRKEALTGNRITVQPSEQVGVRRLAELALEEGELLALRLPDRAAPLLERARRWFQDAGDLVGAAQAAIREVIALVHQGDPKTGRSRLSDLQYLYSQIRLGEGIPALPPWPVSSRPADFERLASGNHPVWNGWLLRLLPCTLLSENAESKTPLTRDLQRWFTNWLNDRYNMLPPAELDLEPADRLPTPPKFWRVALNWVASPVAVSIVALGITTLAILYGVGVLGSGVQETFGLTAAIIVCGFLGLAALGGLITGWEWYRSWLASQADVRLRISARPTEEKAAATPPNPWMRGPSEIEPVALQLVQRVAPVGFPYLTRYRLPFRIVSDQGQSPGIRPYRAAAADVPSQVVQDVTRLHTHLKRRTLPVALNLDRSLDFFAWEAVLAMALVGTDEEPTKALQFYRPGPPLATPLPPAPPAVDVAAGRTWWGQAEAGWRFAKAPVQVREEPPEAHPGAAGKRILHLVGKAEYSTSGWHFRIRRDGQEPLYLPVTRLPLRGYSCLVIQAEPVEALTRLDADREQAAWLRAFAAEVFAAGAGTVVVLPPLTLSLQVRALRCLAEGLLHESPANLDALLNMVSDVRRLIREDVPGTLGEGSFVSPALWPPAQTLEEIAFDVCLFTRPTAADRPYPEPAAATLSPDPIRIRKIRT
jgi:hypothetical protein